MNHENNNRFFGFFNFSTTIFEKSSRAFGLFFVKRFRVLVLPLNVLNSCLFFPAKALIRFRFIGARGAFIRRLPFGVEGGFRPGHMRVCALTLTTFLHTMIFAYCGHFLCTPPRATLVHVATNSFRKLLVSSELARLCDRTGTNFTDGTRRSLLSVCHTTLHASTSRVLRRDHLHGRNSAFLFFGFGAATFEFLFGFLASLGNTTPFLRMSVMRFAFLCDSRTVFVLLWVRTDALS